MARRMGGRRLTGVVAVVLALALSPIMAGASPITAAQIYKPIGFFRFCAEAQLDIANIDESVMASKGISISGSIYADYANDFQFSKSAVSIDDSKILTAQWSQYRDAAHTQQYLIRCKMRTGESLDKGAWPDGSTNNGGRFAVDPYWGFGSLGVGLSTNPTTDQQCSVVNQRTIDNVWANLSPTEQAASPYNPTGATPTLVTNADTVAGDGPTWLQPSPPLSVAAGTMTVHSRSLLAPTSGPTSINARLEGAHYCTLVAPEYLRDVLLGIAPVV